MAIGSGKERIQVIVSKEMSKRIDVYCEKMGVSKSALCGIFIGQGIMNFDKTYEMADNLTKQLVKEIKEEGINNQLKGQMNVDEVMKEMIKGGQGSR